jgi:2'-deoxynucleoside 5'-phosphate N-hydrolase
VPSTIYFSGSISSGRQDVATYRRIVEVLEAEGHRVLAGVVTAEEIGDHGEGHSPEEICARDLRWIDEAELLVAEVSVPSTGVGYEIAYARYRRNLPVICLYRPAYTKRCTAMVAGDRGIELITYDELETVLPALLESLRRAGRYPDRLP